MKLEEQVCSYEQSKQLFELGVLQRENGFWWVNNESTLAERWDEDAQLLSGRQLEIGEASTKEEYIAIKATTKLYFQCNRLSIGVTHYSTTDRYTKGDHYAAFTVAELFTMLPDYEESHRGLAQNYYCGQIEPGDDFEWEGNVQAIVMANRLINLINYEVVSIKEVNERLYKGYC